MILFDFKLGNITYKQGFPSDIPILKFILILFYNIDLYSLFNISIPYKLKQKYLVSPCLFYKPFITLPYIFYSSNLINFLLYYILF